MEKRKSQSMAKNEPAATQKYTLQNGEVIDEKSDSQEDSDLSDESPVYKNSFNEEDVDNLDLNRAQSYTQDKI
jgi:hypothetical protein